VLIEFYAFDDLIGPNVNLVEDVTTHNSINGLVLSGSNAVYSPSNLVNSLRLSILSHQWFTEMFQVLMVPSWEPLTNTLLKTKRFETLLVCPMNWFKISP
jgi:hypothetical protein